MRNCVDSVQVSGLVLAGVSLDEIVIALNEDGDKAVEVDARGLRVTYSRI